MHAAQTDMANVIDFSGVLTGVGGRAMCRKKMLQYIHGIRGPRQNPVSFKQIRCWFRATPEGFLHCILDGLMGEGMVRIIRTGLSRRAGYRYELNTQHRFDGCPHSNAQCANSLIGYFPSEFEATAAYARAAKRLFGSFARVAE